MTIDHGRGQERIRGEKEKVFDREEGHKMGHRVVGNQELDPDSTDIHYRVNQDVKSQQEMSQRHELNQSREMNQKYQESSNHKNHQESDQELIQRHKELGHQKRDHVDRGRNYFFTEDHIDNHGTRETGRVLKVFRGMYQICYFAIR